MLLHKFFTVWLFLLNTHSQAATESRTYYTKDFYIQKVSKNSINEKNWNNYNLSNTTPCRDRIKTIMCLVNPGNPMTDTSPRECQAGGELYAPYFEALYDAYPPILQKMFCSLQVINIEKSFFGTAYAGLIENKDGKILGAHMGIRKSVLDENLNLQTWASWKDQLSFGGISDSYSLTPGLPTIETISPQLGISDFLYFVVAHEFGHILDFSNNLNKMVNCTNETFHQENHPECLMEPSSWGGISWISDERTNLNNDFNHRKDLCFYTCEGKKIETSLVDEIYTNLYSSNFISLYSTTNPWDDFADSLAYYLMNQNLRTQYYIRTSNGSQFDIMHKLTSPQWKQKLEYLDNLLNRTNLIYP